MDTSNEQMSDQSPHELLYTVNRRWDCLQAIVEEPQEKRTLVETLSMPRSTLDTVVRELEGADLVTYHDGVWQPTVAGEATAAVYSDTVDSIRSITTAGQVLSPLSGDHGVPTVAVEGADSFPAEEPVPDAVLTEFLDRIADADRIRGVAPRALSGYTDRVFRTAADNDTTLEMTLADSVFERLSTLNPETVADRLQRPLFSVYRAPVDVEFGLWIGDNPNHIGLIVYADRGVHGVVINRTPAAIEWATDRYRSIQAAAEELTPADVPEA
jgi:predicted transcriptional regulator